MTAKKTVRKAPAIEPAAPAQTTTTTARRPTPEEAMIAMAWNLETDRISDILLTAPMRMQCDLIWATRTSPEGDLHKAAVKARPGLVNAVLISGGEPIAGLPDNCQTILNEDWS